MSVHVTFCQCVFESQPPHHPLLPSDFRAEVDPLKGMTPETTAPSEEKTTDADDQTEQSKENVPLPLRLSLLPFFLKDGAH